MPPVLAAQSYVSAMASSRFLLYSLVSVAGVITVIANALRIHSNFYALTIHLAKSNGTVIVLANFLVLCAILVGRLWQHVFFGELRAMEVERLYDRIWFFVTESLLAFTIFRDDFDVPFALMFGMLLFTKCFHWLLSDRIEWMDQRPYPGPPMLFHIRINALICILWLSDVIAYILILDNLISNGFSGTILFASEYAILIATLMNSAAKYAISITDLRRASNRGGENAPPWEDKSMWVFYVELATGMLIFFMIVFAFYGIPLHIIRDVYITARSFYMRFRDLIRYRTATRNMDERYPNATVEELANMSDRTCIICREEMISPDSTSTATQNQNDTANPPSPPSPSTSAAAAHPDGPNTTPKRLPCGHVFHFYCLRSWLERQQSCPTCRRSVLEENQPANGTRPPAPPQPGAVPQMQNGAQQQGALQQQQRMVGGIVGRVLGMARMPPIVPGQFANGLLPQPAQQQPQLFNQQNFNLPQQAAPGAQGQGWAGAIPAVNQAPEQFHGFWGPDGQWRPWPNDPQLPAGNDRGDGTQQQPETGAPGTPTAASRSAPSPSSSEVNSSDPPSSSATNASPNGSAVPTSSEGIGSQSEGLASPTLTASPRQAAALAAMRRSQSSGSTNARMLGSNPALQDNATSTTPVAESAGDSSSNSTTDSTTINATPSSTAVPSNQASNPSSNSTSPPVPPLIPLFDTTLPTIRVTATPLFTDSFRDYPRRGFVRGRAVEQQIANSSTSTWSGPSSLPYSSLRSGQLPQQLSDEQLAALDTLTRDAIDERLRILESVSARATTCVEELLRVRSVLPPQAGRQGGRTGQGVDVEVQVDDNANNATSAPATPGETNPEAQLEVPQLQ